MTLETERLRLRPPRREDFEAVHRYAVDPEVVRFMSWGPNTPEETRAFLARGIEAAQREPRSEWDFSVVLRAEDALVGGCGLYARRAHYGEYELGYCLAREAWGRGLAAEGIRALLAHGFAELGAHRIYACIDPRNQRSLRLIERLGFRREGLQLRDTQVRGEWRDSLIYARLADESDA